MKPTSLHWKTKLCAAVAAFSALAWADPGGNSLDLGYAYVEAGKYRLALMAFEQAQKDAQARGDAALEAEVHSAAGYVSYLARHPDEAKRQLDLALDMAQKNHDERLEARVRGYLGLVYAETEKTPAQAVAEFERSQSLAQKTGDIALEYAAKLQLARLDNAPARQLRLLQAVASELPAAQLDDASRIDLWLNLTDQLWHLHDSNPAARRLGHSVAGQALPLAEKLGRRRAQSQIEGYWAGWHEADGKLDEAIRLNEDAIRDADAAPAPDLEMKWQAALGRLLAKQGQWEPAIAAYRRAVFHVGEVRNDIPVVYQDGNSSYRETLEPIYRGLASLLLQAASRSHTPQDKQRLLLEAVNTLERLKQSEMEEYFDDRCALDSALSEMRAEPPEASRFFKPSMTANESPLLANLAANLASATGATAILYPAVFADRLEVLLIHDGEIRQRTVSASGNQITTQARSFNDLLRNRKVRYEAPSRQLYQWIVAPVAEDLRGAHVDRLVYVPDGVLRLAPLAAFNDGQGFVAEHYAVITNSGLQFNPIRQAAEAPIGKALLAGLSVPDGPSLDSIPEALLHPANAANLASRAIGEVPAQKRGAEGESPAASRAKTVEALALPGVAEEIHMIGEKLPNTTLLNQTFTSKNLGEGIQSGNYQLVHISSHGYFGHSADQSFIMAYDKTLGIDDVERLMRLKPGQQHPIELVTFSACQTAKGDDRAPLGFSGLAIKANARNALGTLWNVPDIAAKQFMQEYYSALAVSSGDAAIALRQAQKAMLRQKLPLSHPTAWAAFILVGAW